MDRPITTLFMLMSLDGKISPGASDALDVDKDFPKIDGLKRGCLNIMKSSRQPTFGLLIQDACRKRWA